VPRHVPLLLRSGDQLVPSFPLRVASVAAGRDPVQRQDMIRNGDVFPTPFDPVLPGAASSLQGIARKLGFRIVASKAFMERAHGTVGDLSAIEIWRG